MMTKEKIFYLTKEKLERIKKEYHELKQLKASKGKEEISNVLPVVFQDDLDSLDARITELEYILKNSKLIKVPAKEKQNIVNLGATVLVHLDGEIDEFTIVGSLETDPLNKKISHNSPIGQALIGKRVGETVLIKTPIVNHICKIIKIKYNKI